MSRLLWQIRHKWSRQRSLEAWHKVSPDISDDIFEQLYAKALVNNKCCEVFNQCPPNVSIAQVYEWMRQQ